MNRKIAIIGVLIIALFGATNAMASGHRERGMMMHDVRSEYDFLVEMIPHHQEAVDTSLAAAARTERAEFREFASGIATAQTTEIAMMESWLAEWYPSRSGKGDYRPMMRPVEGLSPDRADRAFLEDMIMHHRMAIMMAQSILSRGLSERPEMVAFARQVIEDQNGEIEQMEIWLAEWYGVTAGGHMRH